MYRKNTRLRRSGRGFTIVEILIVVIVLGTLAAVVIPQFSNAGTDARKSSLKMQLQTLQQQIEYYKLQHNNVNPPLISAGWPVLTQYTDINGAGSTIRDGAHPYGPYLPAAPINPLTAPARATLIAADPNSSPGWVYNEAIGKIYATGTESTRYFNLADGLDSSTTPY